MHLTARSLSRRGLVAGLAVAPLAAVSSGDSVALAVSPELARLIRKSGRLNARVRSEAESDQWPPGLCHAAGVLRFRVAIFPCAGLADVLAKAVHLNEAWGEGGMQGEFDLGTHEGTCYLDGMALAIALDLARLAHAFPNPST